MFNVDSKKCLSLLSGRTLKHSRTRNIIAVLAIILTAVLFTSVLSIAMGIIASSERSTMRQVGTQSHAGFKFITQEQYDMIASDPEVKDISYNIWVGKGENPELNKLYTEIRYTEEKNAEWSFCAPETGRLPESGKEIAASTIVLDALSVPHELGAQVPLEFTAAGVKYSDVFTLTGFWEGDQVAMAQQVFVSREYCDAVAPVWHEVPEEFKELGNSSYDAGSINPSIWFSSSWNIEKQVYDLKDRCGFGEDVNEGINWAYAGMSADAQTVILIVAVLFIIMLSGYLIIYNIFYISVSNDIKFYGLLKTIGTTNRQLRKIVRKQALLLCCVGVPAGIALGYLASFGLLPVVMTYFLGNDCVFSKNPLIFIGGAVFTVITVLISCIKPCSFVSRISPVEAVRYTEGSGKPSRKKSKKTKKPSVYHMAAANIRRTPKKAAAVIASLSLSMILLNATVTVVNGFDMDKYVESHIISDFYITNASVTNSSLETDIAGVDENTIDTFFGLPGVTETGRVYMQESRHILSGNGIENARRIYDEYYDMFKDRLAFDEMGKMLREENLLASHIYGVDGIAADKLEISGGTFDAEKFKSGDYVIVSAFMESGKGRYYDIGDKVTVDFGNGVFKEYEVMAIGDIPYAAGPQHSHLFDIYFTLPAGEFIANTSETGALDIIFNVDKTFVESTEEWVSNYCSSVDISLDYRSRSIYEAEFAEMQDMYKIVGGTLSLILAFIGVLNFINSMITSVQSRRRELAVLQAVGMTGKQLRHMLITEGALYSVSALIFTATVGNLLSYALVQAITGGALWFFTYHFTLLPVLCCVPVLAVFSAAIPALCYKNAARISIVDRLRLSE